MFHPDYANTLCQKFPNYFGYIANTCHKITLKKKQYRESLEHVLINVLELKSESTTHKTLIHNNFDSIEDLVNTSDTDTPNLYCKNSNKASESISIGEHNLIHTFIYYLH